MKMWKLPVWRPAVSTARCCSDWLVRTAIAGGWLSHTEIMKCNENETPQHTGTSVLLGDSVRGDLDVVRRLQPTQLSSKMSLSRSAKWETLPRLTETRVVVHVGLRGSEGTCFVPCNSLGACTGKSPPTAPKQLDTPAV